MVPRLTSDTTILAPGMAAADWSVTVPRTEAVKDCPRPIIARISSAATIGIQRVTRMKDLLKQMIKSHISPEKSKFKRIQSGTR
jgi:hypothetical protein